MTGPTYTSIIEFRVHPGREDDFIAAFADCGMLERPRALPDFVSGELLRQADDPACFVVIATWRTPAAYADWGRLSREGVDARSLGALAACLVDMKPGRLFAAAS